VLKTLKTPSAPSHAHDSEERQRGKCERQSLHWKPSITPRGEKTRASIFVLSISNVPYENGNHGYRNDNKDQAM